jgi:hypothetical protein
MISLFYNALFANGVFSSAIGIFLSFAWLWLPIVLISLFLETWFRYIRTKYIMEQGSVLLELRLAKEMPKSPVSMEIVLGALSQPSVGSYLDVFLKGRIRPWFSLELVSLGGEVHFYIWTQKKWKNIIESHIYSQFPNMEIYEVPDYTFGIEFDPEKFNLFGMQLKLNKPDVFPIKSYVEYGLHEDPEEEFKVDPITPLIEFLGSLKPGEQAWIQILIQAHRKENLKDLRINEKPDWKKSVTKEIKKIVEEQSVFKPEDGKGMTVMSLTKQQAEVVTSIQRNVGKPAFETMIRGLYIAPTEIYNPGNIAGLTGGFKQFGSDYLNSFSPKLTTSFDYPWQDPTGSRLSKIKRSLFYAYRQRSFFHPPYRNYHGKPFILSAEELATIFHFPGSVAATPTLVRTPSKKAEAPANIPV